MNNLYLTEIMLTDWLQMLDDQWDEKDTPYSVIHYFWFDWLFNISMNFGYVSALKMLI